MKRAFTVIGQVLGTLFLLALMLVWISGVSPADVAVLITYLVRADRGNEGGKA